MTNHDWRNKAHDDATRAATITEIFGQVVNWASGAFRMPKQHVAYMGPLFGQFACFKFEIIWASCIWASCASPYLQIR